MRRPFDARPHPYTRASLSWMYPVPKRILDVLLGVGALVVLSPLLALVALAVKLDALFVTRDRGRVLYAEPRISRGQCFRLLKFRTLRQDVLARVEGHTRPYERDAANLTRSGRLLKRWYLDELPQLLNIVRGDMSFVGPRAWPPQLVEEQVRAGLAYRNQVVAGLTGPAQLTKGAVNAAYAPRDLDYVRDLETGDGWSVVGNDLRILCRTLGVLARGGGLTD